MIPDKSTLELLYHKEKKTMKEIGSLYGVDRKTISRWLKQYQILTINSRIAVDMPSEKDLNDLYYDKKMAISQICEIYGVGKKAIKSWFRQYNITILPNTQKRFYHIRKVPLTKKQKEFIIGTVLGDGSIGSSGKFKRLSLGHSVKQLDYLLWKKEILGNLVNNIYKHTQKTRNSIIYTCASVGHHEFSIFYNLFYDNNKKVIRPQIVNYLTPFAMAVWYMDDGSAKPYCMKLCTEGFTKKENEILQDAIFVNFDIRCKVCEYNNRGKHYYYLSFNKENSIKLTKLIEPYVIESMKYKLINYRLSETKSQALQKSDDIARSAPKCAEPNRNDLAVH